MAALVNSGRAALAKALKDSVLHVAWGTGVSWWDESRNDSLTFDGSDHLTLSRDDISNLVIKSADGATTYVLGTDYSIATLTGGIVSKTITRLGGGAIASGATVRASYKTNRPTVDVTQTALAAEIGRHTVTDCYFLTPDAGGTIQAKSGARFNQTSTPTRYLRISATFELDDAPTSTIKEVAIFLGTVVVGGLPAGTRYFTTDQLSDAGQAVVIENIDPITRNAATSQGFATVITL